MEQDEQPTPKRRRRSRPEDADSSAANRPRGRALAKALTPEPTAPAPAVDLFPVGSVHVPWSIRLGLVRHEVTAGSEKLGPRRMLLRDTSGLLMVLALVVLLVSQTSGAPAAADGSGDESFPAGAGSPLPGGTLDLLSPTPSFSLLPGQTQSFDVGHATLPPWCADPKCLTYVTPSPSPKPTAKPTAVPTPCPPPDPLATPLATPCPTPAPTPTCDPLACPTPTPDITPPTTPGGLTASAVSEAEIDLSWSASTDDVGVTGYNVYRDGTLVTTTTNTTFADTGRSASTTYSYAVEAFDATGNVSAQATASATTPDNTAPSVPGSVTAQASGCQQIDVSWAASTDNVGVAGYRIYRDSSLLASVGSGTLSYPDLVTEATSHSYTVVAFDAAGNSSGSGGPASDTTTACASP
jgi:chitodextrinase